ncbi:uncharacterized protein Z519_07888 [Cladophialophora bantiana CBS 173.52]|uniref:Uncharacterized protein n=1 Tax=Cladophialophora bantiana (strain ATCC 10958 / CBS 173.52 / CDC B-1940 / NIH 8579) TaxID=1442370 RepID=A0A0D2HFA3_CLAB1|nr:uncharacterized protein Z519_07888 [Cladophialophora bantiana CBS 173.52]KIW91918.1 hypothetical protein Z519_07888 [Cladophialophora bantiana CBS 173.52]
MKPATRALRRLPPSADDSRRLQPPRLDHPKPHPEHPRRGALVLRQLCLLPARALPTVPAAREHKALPDRQPLRDIDEVTRYLEERLETGYDTAAIESYRVFTEMRAAGSVPADVKFQVCIPTPLNALTSAVAQKYKAFDLAVQIGCANEFAVLEETWKRVPRMEGSKPWWCDVDEDGDRDGKKDIRDVVFRGVVDRVVLFAGAYHIAGDVELGFHFCYGDFGHKHFIEPRDMAMMVRTAKAIRPRLSHKVDYIHMPVPKERDDAAYFAPLRELLPLLRTHGTLLYLGLVRERDEEGTKRRLETARSIIDADPISRSTSVSSSTADDSASGPIVTWGIATECGMGRMKSDDVPGTLELMKKLASPITR